MVPRVMEQSGCVLRGGATWFRRCVYEVVCVFELKLLCVRLCVVTSQALERSRRRMALERSKHKDGQV